MKLQYFFSALCFLFAFNVNAQCPEGTLISEFSDIRIVYFETQQQIDDFTVNYPNCTELERVRIRETDEGAITNLMSLSQLNSIEILQIYYNNALTDLSGLHNLVAVDQLYITGNDVLNDISALYNISSLIQLGIYGNGMLNNLAGLENVTSIDTLSVGANALMNFTGLNNLNSVAKLRFRETNVTNFIGLENIDTIRDELYIQLCPNLTTLTGFDNLKHIEGKLSFWNNDVLTNMTGLSNLCSLGAGFTVARNDNVINLSGLDKLKHIAGRLAISQSPSFTSLTGIENVDTIGDFSLYDIPTLTSLSGLENLKYVREGFSIYATSITNFTVLQNLNSIGQKLSITSNDLLNSLEGLENLTYVGKELRIVYNPILPNLNGLENINCLNSLTVRYNEGLSNCSIQNFCAYLVTDIERSIRDNMPGCNSDEEILEGCGDLQANPFTINCVDDLINLKAGWNLISLDVSPYDKSISNVFFNLKPGNLQYVTSYDNGTNVFDPNQPSFLNTLTNVEDGFGYWVKVLYQDVLIVEGLCLEDNFRKPLDTGWNLVAYPPDTPQAPSSYFADLMSSDDLGFVTGFDNGTNVFDPILPIGLNTLQQMENGFGYWVNIIIP